MTSSEKEAIASNLDALLHNKPIKMLEDPGDLKDIQDQFVRLSKMLRELQQFAVRLAAGDVDAPPPSRDNYIAAGLKQLQAQMLHLTWQAQCVAQGDYRQQIDFMGDFSTAFNAMVDQLHSRETSLREQQEVMENIFNLIESIVVVSEDNPNEVLYANEMAIHRFGVRIGINEALSLTLTSIFQLSPSNLEHQVRDEQSGMWYGVIVRTLLWGSQRQARLYYCRDITLHKERESSLDIVANTDELTGINNRRAFDHTYAQIWDACTKAYKPLSLIMFDLDHFKRFNDTYGHWEGDKLLAAFAGILRQCIGRNEDLIARYGGEEFIAALPFTDQDSAIHIANSVCTMTASQVFHVKNNQGETCEASISVSGGVSSVVPSSEFFSSQLIQAADLALYQAKLHGRNRVCFQSISQLPSTGSS